MFVVDDIDDTLERLRKAVRSSWAKWSGIKTRTGSATSAGLRGFSSDSPKNSADRRDHSAVRPHSRVLDVRLTIPNAWPVGATGVERERRDNLPNIGHRSS